MEDKTFQIPSASEKQSYKFLLDATLARRREQAANQIQSQEELDLGMPDEERNEEQLVDSAFAEALVVGNMAEHSDEDPNEESDESDATREEDRAALGLELTPDKNYFRIGEVAQLLSVEPHVLRYWESEFTHIRPTKSGGQRVYNRKTVEALQQIRNLLYNDGFSISGARKKLKEDRREKRAVPSVAHEASAPPERLIEIEKDLRDLIRFAEAN